LKCEYGAYEAGSLSKAAPISMRFMDSSSLIFLLYIYICR